MIRFNCPKCGKRFKVPDEHAGKKGKCAGCKKILEVPSTEQESRLIRTYDCRASKKPQKTADDEGYSPGIKVVFGFIGVVFLGLLILILWAFVFRDTWETDNYGKIHVLYYEGANLIATGDFTLGLEKYQELIELVGNRNLKNKTLSEYLHKSQEEYDVVDKLYIPLSLKQQEAQKLVASLKYDEAINLCNEIIQKYSTYKNDPVTKKGIAALRGLEEQAKERWQKAVDAERDELLPKLVSLGKQVSQFSTDGEWDKAVICLQKIIDAKPEKIWTNEVREIIDDAKIQIINAQHLPHMVDLFKQAYELSQRNEWDDVVDRLQKLIESKPDISTPEIDKVVMRAHEQLANARMVLKEEKRLAEKRKRLEEESRYIEANTTIVICPHCHGSGLPTAEDIRYWEYQVSAMLAQDIHNTVRRGPRKPTVCPKCNGAGTIEVKR